MDMVNVKVNGIAVSVPKGSTILEAARAAGVEIPTLCYLKEINEIGACRICVVEATGARGLVTACVYPVNEGMEITTNSEKPVVLIPKCIFQAFTGIHNKFITSNMSLTVIHTFQSCNITKYNTYAPTTVHLCRVVFQCETISKFRQLVMETDFL